MVSPKQLCWRYHSLSLTHQYGIQATGLDAWASRVKCPARFVSHLHEICIYIYELFIAPALPELLWLPMVWRCPYIEIAFSTLDCSIVPTCGAWCSATAAKGGPLKQSWAEIQHSCDDEPLGVLMQMRNVRVNGFFFFSSLGVLPGVLVDTLSLCSGDFCVECVLIVLHKFYIEL